MYCPRCAAPKTGETNFCNKCGADLRLVTAALEGRQPPANFDWSKTWVAEMLLTDDERLRRKALAAIAGTEEQAVAEMKRVKELKGGIITTCAGIGVSIFLFFLMGAIANAEGVRDPAGAEILRHIWIAGVIPFFVGLAIIFNAIVISGRGLRTGQAAGGIGSPTTDLPALAPPPVVASVTEHTTDLLTEPAPIPRRESESR